MRTGKRNSRANNFIIKNSQQHLEKMIRSLMNIATLLCFSSISVVAFVSPYPAQKERYQHSILKIHDRHHSLIDPELPSENLVYKPSIKSIITRRSFVYGLTTILLPTIANAAVAPSTDTKEGGVLLDAITQSDIGVATRRATVRGAQIADKLDEKWERFSDSLRDEQKCDPVTNRRLFDNGFRKDGSRIGNPVLGGLCTPVPLKELNEVMAKQVLESSENVVLNMNPNEDMKVLRNEIKEVKKLVGPAFERAAYKNKKIEDGPEQARKRLSFNEDLYVYMRATSNFFFSNKGGSSSVKTKKDLADQFELEWGKQLVKANDLPISRGGGILDPLVLSKANRDSFFSPFPKLTPEEKTDLNYNEESLLDALGMISVTLQTLQDAGLIGHWEISIPVDDFGEVVTIAVDDDISLGAQLLLREQQQKRYSDVMYFAGSSVLGIIRASLMNVGITCGLDSFFLDPSTTKQDVYNPTQLLVNLSNIRTIK